VGENQNPKRKKEKQTSDVEKEMVMLTKLEEDF